MANVKELKKRIRSTTNTHKITSAMKLVSAAKLARAQQAIIGARPYAQELDQTVKTLAALVENYSNDLLTEKKENKQTIVLVISSNKGLCGGFNNQLDKEIRAYVKENSSQEYKFFFIGKKVKELLAKDTNVGKLYSFTKSDPTFAEVKTVADELANLFITGEVGRVLVAYNKFNSAISFTPIIKQVLPIAMSDDDKEQLKQEMGVDFKYDEEPAVILDDLIPQSYVSGLFTCVLDAIAAEHGIRMSSMDSATKNCAEMIRTLTLKMNKLRQAAITTELIEVVSGAESLKG